MPLLHRYNVKKQYRTNPFYRYDFQYTINDEGIIQQSGPNTTKYNWCDMYLACESKEYFYLFISSLQALIIPKENLEDHEDEIRNHLYNLLGEKKCKYLYKKK